MSKKYGFTLIEVLIAIVLFAVGILTVLHLMNTNMSFVHHALLKMRATILAQEGLALVFSIRDANRLRGYARDCIPNPDIFTITNPSENDFCYYQMRTMASNSGYLLIGFSPNSYFTHKVISGTSSAWLYTQTADVVYLSPVGTIPSNFSRYIYFSPLVDKGTVIDPKYIVKVTSVVEYYVGSHTGRVALESFIADY